MRAKIKFVAVLVAVVAIGVGFGVARAQQGAPAVTPAGVVVLDTLSVWRMHCTLAPPVLSTGRTVPFRFKWMSFETPGSAQGWMVPDFDDRFWHRGPLTLAPKTALLSKVCLRGKFTVTNPTAVKRLRLNVSYRGGIIVYLNGKELHRKHIGQGKSIADGVAGEKRNISDLSIPNKLLKKGMNVIALEIVRGAYPQANVETGDDVYNVNTCEVVSVRLSAADASALEPNVSRPAGLQVWPADSMAMDMNLDYGDRAEPLRPVTIIGARNGLFTGKALVGSLEPIRGLKVTAGDLQGKGGRIPAASVNIRYGIEWGAQQLNERTRLNYLRPYIRHQAVQFNALAPEPPETVPVKSLAGSWYPLKHRQNLPDAVKPVPGAVVPVWISVKVPADVKAGTYTGRVKIEAQGEKSVQVPLELRVADWRVPDTQDYRTWVDIIQCPDTLAMEYNVPLWSDKHFEMIANSFKLIGETGSRIVYVPLIAHTNLGNEESMVRWIKKGDKFEYDFSIMERYLSVAEKNMGRPKLVVFLVWDVYMMPSTTLNDKRRRRTKDTAKYIEKIGGKYGMGPMVTVFDPTTQKTKLTHLPAHFDKAASKPLWKPLMDELRKRVKKRGLEKEMMLGLIHDSWPTKEEVQFFQDVTGGIPWAIHSHSGPAEGKLMYGITPIGYQAVVWAVRFSDDGANTHGRGKGITKSMCGWKRNVIWSQFDRWTRERHPCTRWRRQAEVCITGAQRGPGRLGGDYWKVIRNKKGKRVGRSHERYPESSWRNLFIPEAILAPGPTGPVATNHLEALREGVQECEARIAIERALTDETLKAKLGPELTKRCEEYLHARHMMMWLSLSNLQFYHAEPGSKRSWLTSCLAQNWRGAANVTGHNWFLSSGWQKRTAKLFELAGEVTRKLDGK